MQTKEKKQTKKELLINHLMEKSEAIKEIYCNKEIISYNHIKGFACAVWQYKGQKPSSHILFRTEAERVQYIENRKKEIKEAQERDILYAAQKQEENKGIQKDSILVCPWGWEQTNIYYYLVIDRKNDFLILQQIGAHLTHDSDMTGKCTPNKSNFIGEPFKKKISKYGGVKISSFQFANLWDGRPDHWTAYA
jgi:hypothetical protein